jgi:serine/threonine-protein phosphatase 2A regulatory subunit A
MVEEINALELLQEEMKTDEVNLKVNAIHRMKTVILSIGPEQTKDKLVDYLEGLIKQEDDEVLFAIAEELGKVWDLHSDKTLFLGLLETLCKQDETEVRN